MSAGQPPRPGFPGQVPVRAAVRPGAVPLQPGVQPGPRPMQPVGQARPMAPRPGMMPQAAGQPGGIRPMQARPVMAPLAARPPMQVPMGSRLPVASMPPQGVPRPGQPLAATMRPQYPVAGRAVPGAAMQPVRAGLVAPRPMQPRVPSPVRQPGAAPQQIPQVQAIPGMAPRPASPAGMHARPMVPAGAVPRPGTPTMARAIVPGQAVPPRPAAGLVPGQLPSPAGRLPGPAVRVASPAPRPATAAGAPIARPPAGVPMPGVRAAAPPAAVRAATPPAAVRAATPPAAAAVRPAAVPSVVRPAAAPQVQATQAASAAPRPVPAATQIPAAPGRGFPISAAPSQAGAAPPAAPAAAPAPKPTTTAGGDRVSTGEINMDDVKEIFRQMFGGEAPEPTQRAAPGKEGRDCKVIVNMYPVTLPKGHVFHYDIEIFSAARPGPEGTTPVPAQKRARCASTLVNREVIDSFSKQYRSELGNCILGFDGRKNMYTRRLLPFTEHIFNNVEAEVNGEKSLFVVRITYVATVSFDALHAMYENNQPGTGQFQDAIQVADVILRTGPTLAFVPVGRSFFAESGKPINLSGNREVWFGFYSSIRLGAWKPLVNIDMSATAFYVPSPLLDFATTVLRKRSRADLKAGLNDRERVLLSREIRTLRVTVSHLDSRRQYRIEGLRPQPASQEEFELNGSMITVAQYFFERYQKTLEYPNLPCIYTGKGNTFLPLEVCTLVKGQHCRKKLDEMQTANMIRQTALVPKDRFERIKQSVEQLKTTSAQICKEFDMSVETKPIELEARILPPPAITLGNKKRQMPKDGVWKCDTFLKPANIEKWVLAVLGKVSGDKPKKIVDLFQQEGGKLGMKIAPPKLIHTYGSNSKPRQVLEDVKNKHPDVEMTVVVLDPRSDYGALKAEAECSDLCMRTQCVKDRNIETKFNSMFAVNLLQKINTKMGGRNNGVMLGNQPETLKKPFMAIGVDVNHPAPGDTTPSVAAFVASMDAIPAQYYACTSVQLSRKGSRSEYVVETKSMFLECLTEFYERNKVLPAHIFIFRDGVADAQFDAVRIFELGAIRKACLEFRSDYTPGMTFIVVQKRHHVRFMPAANDKGHGRTGNIHAGTIIDSKIINPAIFDFYLCSHQGIQGTSRAAHYHVVHDDVHHSQDDIYRICYNFCHTYARCPRAVSIPAPAYYAHLAAFRAKEHIKGRAQHNGPYAESNSGSVRSSSSSEPDLDKFQAAQKVLARMRGSMYFV